MRILTTIILFIALTACSTNWDADKANVNLTDNEKNNAIIDITVIDTKFPLNLSSLNFSDSNSYIQLNDEINSKIEQTIKDYYFNDCSGDSAQTYFSIKDTYINTIRLHDSLQTIFVVLIKHLPDGFVNSKILFYNNSSRQFNTKTLDFNIHALYYSDDGKLKPTLLKELFNITTPEIELIENRKNGTKDFKFTRLYHNGTANAIETTILHVTEEKIDTIDLRRNNLNVRAS